MPDQPFDDFWKHLPQAWQRGLYIALRGGAWSGDLTDVSGNVEAVVFVVHPHLAGRVTEAITGEPHA